tara:strand:- start:25 stop:219 length:195 start_codon:yes stop_codon:yes gene_type:complete
MTPNISEFERTKPTETLEQINLLIKMQKDNNRRMRGDGGARVNGKWYVFMEELEKLEKIFKEGK